MIEIKNGIRIKTPSEGMWLYNERDKIISDKVFLGIYANEDDWVEITEEKKVELKTLWGELENEENTNVTA
jgi:hypothetical protein